MKALILIGGLGTRLRPLTCNTPKPMLPLLNRPFLTYQLDLIKRYGIKEVIFCISYLPKIFKDYFGDGKIFGIKVHYVLEKNPLGTGGAIKNAQKYINEPMVIFNGDVLTDLDLGDFYRFHKKKKAKVTVALTRVKDPTAYGLIKIDKKGTIKQFIEKPGWDEVTCNTINAGTYLFEPEMLKYIPDKVSCSVEREIFPQLLEKKESLYGYIPKNCYWLDMGTLEKYMQAHFDILKGKLDYQIPGRKSSIRYVLSSGMPYNRRAVEAGVYTGRRVKISPDTQVNGKLVVGNNSIIDKNTQIHGMVIIGNNCSIAKDVILSDSVVLDNVRIGEGAKLENCIVDNNCKIEEYAVLNKGTAIGKGSIIKAYSRL